ncbi:MAG: acyl-CoA thioesterase [Bryobacteraceae bacterium]
MDPSFKFPPASQIPGGPPDLPPAARPVRESTSEYSELALPNDANALGFLLGGKVMHLVDLAGALAAMRHARRPVVTASIDHLSFLHPVHIGQLILLRSSVNRAFHTSMEVGVKVFVEDLLTGESKHTSSAYLTFVAIDPQGHPVPVPCVIPETQEEKRRYEEAGQRRAHRLELKKRSAR